MKAHIDLGTTKLNETPQSLIKDSHTSYSKMIIKDTYEHRPIIYYKRRKSNP